jgi:hypothetical protein
MTTEILKPPYPPFVDIGTCPDCGLDWRMSRAEYANWVEKKVTIGLDIPKRCPDCRAVRRSSQIAFGNKIRSLRSSLSKRMFNIANDIKDGVYEDKRHELALMILSLADEIAQIPDSLETTKKKGQNEKGQAMEKSASSPSAPGKSG